MKSLFRFTVIICFLISCTNNEKKVADNSYLIQLTEINKSLINSNSNLTPANETLYKSLKAKLEDPVTSEKTKPWYEKALQAKKLSDEMIIYIDTLKASLKREAGLGIFENPETKIKEEKYKEDDRVAATRLFGNGKDGKNQGDILKKKLIKFRKDMLAIDPQYGDVNGTTFPIEDLSKQKILGLDGVETDFTTAYFQMTPTVAALTLLSKFQNNIKNAENSLVSFCHSKVGEVKVVYDQFTALVGQSSNYLMPGEELEISAGVGAFSKAAQPQVSIGGVSVALGTDGRAIQKFRVSGSGEQSKVVVVTYTKPDGTKETKKIDVKYRVGGPCP